VYVGGLSRLLVELDATDSLEAVFFPSSTFVDDAPVGFAEYVAAKLAGENFCQVWQRLRPGQRVVSLRLPPLVTDQTAARLGVDTAGNLDVLAPAVRLLCQPRHAAEPRGSEGSVGL
jgi:hypothetical protein